MAKFYIGPDEQALISVGGLFEGEEYIVYRLACTTCDPEDERWVEYRPDGALLLLTQEKNPVVIAQSGWYKVEPNGVVNCDAIVCYDKEPRCCRG